MLLAAAPFPHQTYVCVQCGAHGACRSNHCIISGKTADEFRTHKLARRKSFGVPHDCSLFLAFVAVAVEPVSTESKNRVLCVMYIMYMDAKYDRYAYKTRPIGDRQSTLFSFRHEYDDGVANVIFYLYTKIVFFYINRTRGLL